MKKLLFIVLVVLTFAGCTCDIKDTVSDPKKETTVQLQELPKDTVVISIDNGNLYVFNKQNEVVYKTQAVTRNYVVVHCSWLLITGFLSFILLVVIIGKLTE